MVERPAAPPAAAAATAPARTSPAPAVPASRPAAPTQPAITKTIPQPVVTGSAATGQFIQLPGMAPKGEPGQPRVEIKDRDEELRRMGRSNLLSRGPGGQTWGRAPGGGGQRPGGPPKKRVAAAGKKLKQTQITTPAEHKRLTDN